MHGLYNNKLLYAVDRAIIEYKYSNKMIKLCFHLVVGVHNPGQFQLPVRIAIDHNYYVTLTKLQYYSQLYTWLNLMVDIENCCNFRNLHNMAISY